MIAQLEYIGYKDLPKELKDYVDSKLPKEGEVVRFEELTVKNGIVEEYNGKGVRAKRARKMKNSLILSNRDTVADKQGNPVKIAVVSSIQANPKTGAAEQIFKPVKLTATEQLQMVFTRAKARQDMNLFAFMTLTNQNKDNVDKFFYTGEIKPKFTRLDKKKTAEDKLAFLEKVDEAKSIVRKWDDETMFRFARLQGWSNVNPTYYEPSQLRLDLMKYCEKKPEAVTGFGHNYDSRFKAWVDKLETTNMLQKDKLKWVSPNTGEALLTWAPGEDAYVKLREFITDEDNADILEEFEKAAGKI